MKRLDALKREALEANLALKEKNLIISTWGNVSVYDEESGLMIIKASGVPYSVMGLDDMVVVDSEGRVIDSTRRPSSDTPTHLYLYRHFGKEGVRSIVHTHSQYATIWAQSCLPLPCYGTTHADYFHTPVPCTRQMRDEEIKERYEENTGKVIVEALEQTNPIHTPAVLVASHGPFTWGKSGEEAVFHAEVLEYVAKMGLYNRLLTPSIESVQQSLSDKHYFRKFGPGAYYGQS
ncbi:MAG: L-ribulose-5-phosphate 4-epimerase AraD [Sphaerochaeta sp.]|jgi:L-ribulose-5-phosphate 4-epimerase|nr:L-ribulose-5-phosphate 4-epimerase AraD [Sphaerochaeta sp.]